MQPEFKAVGAYLPCTFDHKEKRNYIASLFKMEKVMTEVKEKSQC